jgi:hypothetical protein
MMGKRTRSTDKLILTTAVLLLASGGASAKRQSDGPAHEPPQRGFNVVPEPSTPNLGSSRRLALVVAVSDYEHWPKLENPKYDADRMMRVLRDQYGFELCDDSGCGKERGVLTDPTKKNFVDALLQTVATSREGDDIIVFVAGHGYHQSGDGYLVLRDSPQDCETGDCYPLRFVSNKLREDDASHVLVVLDTCFSGAFGLQRGAAPKSDHATVSRVVREYSQRSSRVYVTSGGLRSVGDGAPGEGSPFANALLGSLKEASRYKTHADLVAALERARLNGELANSPTFGHFMGDKVGTESGTFLFVDGGAPDTPVVSSSLAQPVRVESDSLDYLNYPPTWVLTAGGALTLGAGIALGVSYYYQAAAASGDVDTTAVEALSNEAAIASYVLFGLGGAALLAGGIWWAVKGPEALDIGFNVVPVVAPTFAGAQLEWSF